MAEPDAVSGKDYPVGQGFHLAGPSHEAEAGNPRISGLRARRQAPRFIRHRDGDRPFGFDPDVHRRPLRLRPDLDGRGAPLGRVPTEGHKSPLRRQFLREGRSRIAERIGREADANPPELEHLAVLVEAAASIGIQQHVAVFGPDEQPQVEAADRHAVRCISAGSMPDHMVPPGFVPARHGLTGKPVFHALHLLHPP